MSEQNNQAVSPQPDPANPEPESEAIGISAEDLSGLGDLSALQNQDISLDGDAGQPPAEPADAALPESSGSSQGASSVSIMPADFQPLAPANSNGGGDHSSIDMLMDIPLKITVELGRARMVVRDVLNLQSGSVVELDRMAGEVVNILINERLIAKGEVVVVDDKFGVRITEMIGSIQKGNGLP